MEAAEMLSDVAHPSLAGELCHASWRAMGGHDMNFVLYSKFGQHIGGRLHFV